MVSCSESDVMQVIGAISPGVGYLRNTYDAVRAFLCGKHSAHKSLA